MVPIPNKKATGFNSGNPLLYYYFSLVKDLACVSQEREKLEKEERERKEKERREEEKRQGEERRRREQEEAELAAQRERERQRQEERLAREQVLGYSPFKTVRQF